MPLQGLGLLADWLEGKGGGEGALVWRAPWSDLLWAPPQKPDLTALVAVQVLRPFRPSVHHQHGQPADPAVCV